jgi:enolase-phosphatase E1
VSVTLLGARAVVLDIEGTTTPIEFVYDVLFPFAQAHAAAYLEREQGAEACRAAVALLREEQKADRARGESPPEPLAEYVGWLIERDRKSHGLKALQGLIWQDGYRTGELRGQVFEDVPPALERWRAQGLSIHIYSSGSVLAQRLLFRTTSAGDLTKLLNGYFDTGVGSKTSSDSYRTIVKEIDVAPGQTLFVSDVSAELDAAQREGLRTVLCDRRLAPSPTASVSHPVIHSFGDILT